MEKQDHVGDFENACENAVSVQEELLTGILLKNSICDYLQRLGSPSTLQAFKSQVPIVSYDDIWQDIQRVADGSTEPILCTDPIVQFAHSSGTSSGKHKIIPQTRDIMSGSRRLYETMSLYISRALQLEPDSSFKPAVLSFHYCGEQHKTKCGLPIGAMSTNHFKSDFYQQDTSITHTTPRKLVAIGPSDWRQTTYCHLLCGLVQRQKVGHLQALFAYTICEVMRMFRREWKDLCQDISSKTLSKTISDERLRVIVLDVLQRELEGQDSSKLAEEISGICSRDSWEGIIPLLWPRAKYVQTVVTGAMLPYAPALRNYAGDLPLICVGYGSSEGLAMAINIDPVVPPERVVFTLVPYTVFFEFIPVDGDEESIVGIEGVEAGKQYELVITTSQGLYRYKVGDVLKVVGFFKQAPQVAFSYRKNAVLSINTEKVDEQELQRAVLKSFGDLMVVANFTSYADFETEEPPHYVIFCELRDSDDYLKHDLIEACCEKLDKSFENVRYLMGRVNKTIGPLELVIVKPGTFEKLMEMAVESGAAPGQYKTPRCVTGLRMLKVLREQEEKSFRSSVEVPGSLLKAWEPSFPCDQKNV